MARKSVKMKLNARSINGIIKKLEGLNIDLSQVRIEILREAVDGAVQVIEQNTPVDTGETINSTTYEITEKGATIKQSGDHVLFNEYGTGIVGSQGEPYPRRFIKSRLGIWRPWLVFLQRWV